ncbi:OLC1v1013717C1 [Oldenlandia corymbosa var. corymbosa]|uniref:OLC1v1013717C1 n=1 Tax=Oldenlandia corymbosa var. corymbosa TaxID=529605 RepID=A0AAV1DZ01_OLDCO|nr:OLC1v1013717C1 [Oldenlandia corymbosa var. corymbosa]
MKKKKQKTTGPSETAAEYPDELKALIHSHGVFFDKLVELIPARFYLPPNDDASDNPRAYYQGLSKAAKAAAKKQSRANRKLLRRYRLDPEKIAQSSTLEVLKQSLESNAKTEAPTSGEDVARSIDLEENQNNKEDGTGSENAARNTVTYEELRQRLRKKIESLRGNRGSGGGDDGSNRSNRKGKEVGDNKGKKDLKRKRDGEGSSGKDAASGASEGEEIIEYGKVKLGDDELEGKKKKKKKLSKEKELERAKRLAEVKRENPNVAVRESWKAAEKRAMGVKVHDNPKLLRESMKKDKKRKEKNAEKWKDRVETQKKSKDERQQKRKENIEGRIHDKKMRKIAKREKKLLRAGFEGRKDEYITKD